MALRSTRKLVLNISSQPPRLCTSLLTIISGKRLCTNGSNIIKYNQPCGIAVTNRRPKKEQVIHFNSEVVSMTRPDEFHKLPPKCSACGVVVQTKHETQIGYIDETELRQRQLAKLVCVNCYRLRFHDSPELCGMNSYDAMAHLRHLRRRKALVLYIVDLFDIEGTMLQNIIQLVGKNKRMIIVGNKIDRFPLDDKDPIQQIWDMSGVLKDTCFRNGLENCINFRDVALISARTGFGLTQLVEKIILHRDDFMDVYLVGCANTGKSTLYNLLINLLSVRKSIGLPQQAIVHHIPRTTSGLVRERINTHELEGMFTRLNEGPWEIEDANVADGYDEKQEEGGDFIVDAAHKNKQELLRRKVIKYIGQSTLPLPDLHEKPTKTKGKECFLYDTPGILNKSQIVQYLTPLEINYLDPAQWVVPRTFILKRGNSLFVGGLARLDYTSIESSPLEGKEIEDKGNNDGEVDSFPEELPPSDEAIYVTAMVSLHVPIHITPTETAEETFEEWFSDNILELPKGTPERFKEFPKLEVCRYTVVGESRNVNACDLVLHGVGWLSIAALLESRVGLALHTPNGLGQELRLKPLLPRTVQKKKGRGLMPGRYLNQDMYGYSIKRSPQLVQILQRPYEPINSWQAEIDAKKEEGSNRYQPDKRNPGRLGRI